MRARRPLSRRLPPSPILLRAQRLLPTMRHQCHRAKAAAVVGAATAVGAGAKKAAGVAEVAGLGAAPTEVALLSLSRLQRVGPPKALRSQRSMKNARSKGGPSMRRVPLRKAGKEAARAEVEAAPSPKATTQSLPLAKEAAGRVLDVGGLARTRRHPRLRRALPLGVQLEGARVAAATLPPALGVERIEAKAKTVLRQVLRQSQAAKQPRLEGEAVARAGGALVQPR